jgi:hypothetical protein
LKKKKLNYLYLQTYLISETNPQAKKNTTQNEHGNIFRAAVNGTTGKEENTT